MPNPIRLSMTQKKIVEFNEGALLVVAGPGSGKTRVLTERARRILSENNGHFRILALTFTNKAANEMKERLAEFPDINQRAFIGTLHSFCTEVLANRGKPVGIENSPNIFEQYQDRKEVLYRAVIANPDLNHELKKVGNLKDQDKLLSRWLEQIGDFKNRLLLPDVIEDDLDRRIYQAYNAELRASNALDYDDLLLLTYRLFIERPKIAEFYRKQYRYIFIDEAQDLNEAQYGVVQALCGSEFKNVMMVGDPKQAIFVWNGANPKYLDLFKRDFQAVKIKMDDNFRSSLSVVKAARKLFPDYEVEGHLPIQGELTLIEGQNEENEANLILDYIQNILDQGHPDIEGKVTLEKCAVLARNRYVFSSLEKELVIRKWPYYKQLSTQHESESNILEEFELCMRIAANPRDRMHLGLLLKRWNISNDYYEQTGFSSVQDLLQRLNNYAHEDQHVAVVNAIKRLDCSGNSIKMLPALAIIENYALSINDDNERALILEDINVWHKHWDLFLRTQPGGQRSLSLFLGQVALGSTQQMRQEGLALITVHSAKGLEFEVVVVMGMAEGIFPDYRANGLALEEEKRNAFVAFTRSMRLLAVSYSQMRTMPWGSTRLQQPSRFLKDIGLIK